MVYHSQEGSMYSKQPTGFAWIINAQIASPFPLYGLPTQHVLYTHSCKTRYAHWASTMFIFIRLSPNKVIAGRDKWSPELVLGRTAQEKSFAFRGGSRVRASSICIPPVCCCQTKRCPRSCRLGYLAGLRIKASRIWGKTFLSHLRAVNQWRLASQRKVQFKIIQSSKGCTLRLPEKQGAKRPLESRNWYRSRM